MASSHPSASKPSRRWGKFVLLGCITLPLAICAIGGLFISNRMKQTAAQLPQELTKLKALGIPTDAIDLAPQPPLTDKENAARPYGSLVYQLDAIKEDSSQKDTVKLLDTFCTAEADPKDLNTVSSALDSHRSLFSDADKAAPIPKLDFGRNYTLGVKLEFPEYVSLRRLGKWQASRAKVLWMRGNRTEALKVLGNVYRLSDQIGQEPHLIAELVSISTRAVAQRVLNGFIGDARNDPTALKQLESLVASYPAKIDIREALGAELVMGRYSLQKLDTTADIIFSANEAEEKNALLDRVLGSKSVRDMFEARWCEAWRKTFEAMPGGQKNWPSVHAILEKRSKEIDADKSWENIMNRILFPITTGLSKASAKQVADYRLSLLSLKLLQIRGKGLPADLSGLGQLSIDPMSEKPFGYERKGRTFRVWSVGHDLVDNGGVVKRPKTTGNNGFDIVLGFDMPIPQVTPTVDSND